MNIYKKLGYVQENLHVAKTKYNKFGDFYYRSCEDILTALKPLLKEQELILNIADDVVLIGERYYVKAIANIIDSVSGEKISATAFARENIEKAKMDVAQVTGSASSYARKYALNGLLCLDDTKDPDDYDNNQLTPQPPKKSVAKKPPTINDEQVALLMKKCSEHNKDINQILINYKITNLKNMTVGNFEKLMKRFEQIEKGE